MLPLFPFVAGVLAGAAAVSLCRNPKSQGSLPDVRTKLKKTSNKTQETLRRAAVSGLTAIESSSARWRDRLQTAPETPVAEEEAAPTNNVKKTKAADKAHDDEAH